MDFFPGCFVVTDISSLRMFCHHVLVGFATTDVLSLLLFCHQTFFISGCFVTYVSSTDVFPTVVLSTDVLSPDVLTLNHLFASDILNQKHIAHTFELLAVRRISKLFDLNHRSWLSPRLLTCMLFRMILTVFFMFLKRLLCESTYFLT
jgi:hypothetical protein